MRMVSPQFDFNFQSYSIAYPYVVIAEQTSRLDEAMEALRRHAARGRVPGLTEPDQPSGEQWDSGQVWAHLSEIISYIATVKYMTS